MHFFVFFKYMVILEYKKSLEMYKLWITFYLVFENLKKLIISTNA